MPTTSTGPRLRHEWRWTIEWWEPSEVTGDPVLCEVPRSSDDLADATARWEQDAAGGWVKPHYLHPRVSDLHHVVRTRERRRWRHRTDPKPVRVGVDLDPPDAHQPALDLEEPDDG